MIRYKYQSLVPICFEYFPYVSKNTSLVIIQHVGIRSLGVHETNMLIGKFLLYEFVEMPAKNYIQLISIL